MEATKTIVEAVEQTSCMKAQRARVVTSSQKYSSNFSDVILMCVTFVASSVTTGQADPEESQELPLNQILTRISKQIPEMWWSFV
ncbi:hypothetical protein ACMD2_17363 [Ananas comosus]|uniref:Uncharacterized protein n=1 Tax=Ananas comosus TaxID=4615 RepID=A0A199V654_ANACO|nr:hypothetical protein ACMD2_17363 [Ananas comosus]